MDTKSTSWTAQPLPTHATPERWPALPLEHWRDTRATLHLWTQVVGKTRLALAPHVNHWWQVPLYVSARGLTTTRIPYQGGGFEVVFDFVDHALRVDTDQGASWTMPLAPRSVASFYHEYLQGLHSLGIEVRIWPQPVELAGAIPFPDDEVHAAYDADSAHRFWLALSEADRLLHQFRSGFIGKSSPVHFFWGSFDLACTRFSGRTAPAPPGGVPNVGDWVMTEAYSRECSSAGWWPGNVGGPVAEPAFYAYAYPEPDGYAAASSPSPLARYDSTVREWVLPYERVRTAADPDGEVMKFLEGTYAAAADLAGWSRQTLERTVPW
ncbi:MAG: DUF5996 family protein, partial [Gemmatimonadaceae bacterium]